MRVKKSMMKRLIKAQAHHFKSEQQQLPELDMHTFNKTLNTNTD